MKKYQLTEEEKKLFRETVGPVKKVSVPTPPPPAKRIVKTKVRQPVFEESRLLSTSSHLEPVSGEDQLFFAREGVAPKTLRQLKKGLLRCEETLDLHHLTIAEAEGILHEFLEACFKHGLRHVNIIHGKGFSTRNPTPILKNQVNNWLRNHPSVLAFCSAQNKDGGTGAVYILLKRPCNGI